MRTVHLRLHVPNTTAQAAYATLADLARYPDLAEAVRSVAVTAVAESVTISTWEVAFRAGLLRWTEEDRYDPAARTIAFRQLEGDVALFDGTWQCDDAGGGCDVTFTARLDMGIPSLADALEPIAVRTLIDNTVAIVRGLLGSAEVVSTDVAAPAKAGAGS